MATKLREDNTHGEEDAKPRFQGESNGVYDDESAAGNPSDPRGNDRAAGDPSDPRGGNVAAGNASDPRGGTSRQDIKQREGRGASSVTSGAAAKESSMLAGATGGTAAGGYFRREIERGQGIAAKFKQRTRKQVATVLITGVVGGGGIFGFGIVQGPLQFVHFAQKLTGFHMNDNDDMSSRRMVKILMYAKGDAQRSRLGMTANKAADVWEKKLLAESGLRPVYQEGNKRFIGFEIVNEARAERFLGHVADVDSRSSKRVESSMGRGAEIKTADKVTGAVINNGAGDNSVRGETKIIDLSQVSFEDRKAWIKTVGQATQTNKVASAMSSRLLIKRAGVEFHPLNKLKGKMDDAIAKKIADRRASNITDGIESSAGANAEATVDEDGDGKADKVADVDQEVSDESKKVIEEYKSKGSLAVKPGPAAIVGVMCAVKQFGNNIEDYKFINNIMPMIRMGFSVISVGSQVMSGDDVDLATMGVLSKNLYDKEQKTSFAQAESYRAEEGKTGGVKMPQEANLKNQGSKPPFFNFVDGIPGLGTTCGVVAGIMGLPIIKQAADAVGTITGALANGVLSLGGTSTDEITESALKIAAGKAINPDAKGAEFGNLANTGAFLAANDQAVSMGGKDLNDTERARLALLNRESQKIENSSKSFIARYVDPFESSSITAAFIDNAPNNTTQAAAMISNPFKSVSSYVGSTFAMFSPKASAATAILYDYGVPKVGFSVEEQRYEEYENPYEMAMQRAGEGQVTLEDDLGRLNERYGIKCFGVEVTTDETGVHYSTVDKSELQEVYKNRRENPDCKRTDDRLNQYRMYIADVQAALGAACYMADDEAACAELGMGTSTSDGAADSGDSGGSLPSGDSKELAKKILDSGKINVEPKYASQIKDIADGKGGCNVSPTILSLLVAISEKHTVTVSSLNRFCTKTLTDSGVASYHYRDKGGHAVDFSMIGGEATTGGDAVALKLIADITPILPSGSGIGQSNCRGSALKLPSGISEFSDSCNHLHIQVPVKQASE